MSATPSNYKTCFFSLILLFFEITIYIHHCFFPFPPSKLSLYSSLLIFQIHGHFFKLIAITCLYIFLNTLSTTSFDTECLVWKNHRIISPSRSQIHCYMHWYVRNGRDVGLPRSAIKIFDCYYFHCKAAEFHF